MGDHPAWFNWLMLVVGVLYLLADLGVVSFMSMFNWYTVAFVLLGLVGVAGDQ